MKNNTSSQAHKERSKRVKKSTQKDNSTSYDTSQTETANPQKVKEATSSDGEHLRSKQQEGEA